MLCPWQASGVRRWKWSPGRDLGRPSRPHCRKTRGSSLPTPWAESRPRGRLSLDTLEPTARTTESNPASLAAECPLCKQGVPINSEYAHGKVFLTHCERPRPDRPTENQFELSPWSSQRLNSCQQLAQRWYFSTSRPQVPSGKLSGGDKTMAPYSDSSRWQRSHVGLIIRRTR